MALELCGYFDHNFGDDYMQRTAAYHMSEHKVYIDRENGSSVSLMLLEEPNVSLKNKSEIKKSPKLLVTGSGFMVNSFSALKCELIWFLKSKHIADFCVGCNIEPFNNRISEWLVAQKLKKFKYIICRDKKSLEWVRKKCPSTPADCMPDILFAMPKEWIPDKTSDGKLGISLIKSDDPEYYHKMAEAADYWIEKTGKGVILLAFDVGSENDTSACETTGRLIKHRNMVDMVMHGVKGEIPEAFSRCEKIIGARFHSAVLSIKMNIDFYPIIYRMKTQNLISDISYPVKGSYIDSVDLSDIKKFLRLKNVGFKLDESYEFKVRQGFESLKSKLEKV